MHKPLPFTLPHLKPGLSKTYQKTIEPADTLSFGHGALTELMATPTLTALLIEASVSVIDPMLPEGYVTVGLSTSLTYLNPTFIGMTVTAESVLAAVEGRRLVFEIMAFDELGQIARGRHERCIVHAAHFMQTARKRCESVQPRIK
ncbi:MAG: hypothetical protein HPY67_05900 [Syntrophaceae bacterium]|nr:hypothetical protein [Syntrophaceae bacterium]